MSETLRQYMIDELAARVRRNPRYSLRSFARCLGQDPSVLTKLLSGKRSIGPRLARSLGAGLGFAVSSSASYMPVPLDRFKIVADWYHFAILELMKVRDFRPDAAWVAGALGLATKTVTEALERLEKAELLAKQPDGSWIDLSSGQTTSMLPQGSHPAIRQHQSQVLDLAIRALDHVSPERRTQTSMTMAIDKSRLPEAKERVKRFRREMDAFLTAGDSHDEVYHLSISLYPVSDTTYEGDHS